MTEPKPSLVLAAPDDNRRRSLASVIAAVGARVSHELAEYPDPDAAARLIDSGCEAVMVDLDGGLDPGLALIETLCRLDPSVTVIACSSRNEADMVIRAMRAGAREFLAEPLAPAMLGEALARMEVRRRSLTRESATGRTIVFQGAKGGTGVTTLAINFSVALAKEASGGVALVDLHPQLGGVALGLGLAPRFSLVDALANASRLDADFLSTLLTPYESGLVVLASPEEHGSGAARSLERGADKLFRILREEFAFVVVDAGPCSENTPDIVFEIADSIGLVVESNLPSLRNARRMLAYLAERRCDRGVEIVLNRYNARQVEIDEASTTKALARPVDWKIPNDYIAVTGSQNLGIPLVKQDTPYARAVREMARVACGRAAHPREQEGQAALRGERWKFWISNNTRPLSTVRS